MVAARWTALLIAVLSLQVLGAQDFKTDEFFGKGVFVAKEGKPFEGALSLPLAGEDLPSFLDLSRSGEGRVADCFTKAARGLVVAPADKESAELELDAGFTSAEISVNIVELELGGSVSIHIKGRGEKANRYLAEATYMADGSLRLRLRVQTAIRPTTMPGTEVTQADCKAPQKFEVTVSATSIEARIAALKTSAAVKLSAGFNGCVAVSDGRARLSGLGIIGPLDAAWMNDAAVRLQARKTLARLREYATYGLLKGVAAVEHPELAAALAAYSKQDLAARTAALKDGNYAARRDALLKIAAAYPKLAAARHEAGIACLLAGDPQTAEKELLAAQGIVQDATTSLALAEAYRRLRKYNDANLELRVAKPGLPAELQPDWELLSGRLLAAQGDFSGAASVLSTAGKQWPKHEQLADFAASAADFTASPTEFNWRGFHDTSGPFLLNVKSDLPAETVTTLFKRLKPYTESFARWLPRLPEKLDGTIVIYSSPEEYLRAALIVAGDNLDNVAGMYVPGKSPRVIACRGFGEDELVRTLVHELWHLCYAAAGVEGDLPAWVNEGMAVYLSAGVPNKDGVLGFDTLPTEFEGMKDDIKKALGDEKAVVEMLSAGREKFYLPENLRLNYGIAWAVVRYLATSGLTTSSSLTSLIGKTLNDQMWVKNDAAKILADIRKSLDSVK